MNRRPCPTRQWFPLTFSREYQRDEITIDLVGLCRSAGVRLVTVRVAALHPSTRQVAFVDRSPLTYDLLSLGIGSVPPDITRSSDPEFVFTLRPLATLIDRLQRPDDELRGRPHAFHFVIVGGGASGCELALAIHKRLEGHSAFRLSVLQGNARPLPRFPATTVAIFQRDFSHAGSPGEWAVV